MGIPSTVTTSITIAPVPVPFLDSYVNPMCLLPVKISICSYSEEKKHIGWCKMNSRTQQCQYMYLVCISFLLIQSTTKSDTTSQNNIHCMLQNWQACFHVWLGKYPPTINPCFPHCCDIIYICIYMRQL